MKYLAGHVVPIDEIGCGRPGVCLTFDDAFACLLDYLIPLAIEMDLPVSIFPVTDNFNATPQWKMPTGHPEKNLRTMSRDELIALYELPLVTIGSHTATHPRLGDVLPTVARNEMLTSRDALENLTGIIPRNLALPHGSYNSHVCDIAKQAGYCRIFTLEPKVNVKLSDDGRVGRFSVDPDMWMIEFQLTAAGAYGYLLYLRRMMDWMRASANRYKRSSKPPMCPSVKPIITGQLNVADKAKEETIVE